MINKAKTRFIILVCLKYILNFKELWGEKNHKRRGILTATCMTLCIWHISHYRTSLYLYSSNRCAEISDRLSWKNKKHDRSCLASVVSSQDVEWTLLKRSRCVLSPPPTFLSNMSQLQSPSYDPGSLWKKGWSYYRQMDNSNPYTMSADSENDLLHQVQREDVWSESLDPRKGNN